MSPPAELPIDHLDAHPDNSNVMPAALLDKLAREIEHTGLYPPVIVRALGGRYQILDGHHRIAALRRLGRPTARCVVWSVDDQQALLLLATLNRLRGDDDPHKRAELVAKLRESMDLRELAKRLPEDSERIRKLLKLRDAPPSPAAPSAVADLPVCLHFFVLPAQRDRVERRLRAQGGTREAALLALLGLAEADADG